MIGKQIGAACGIWLLIAASSQASAQEKLLTQALDEERSPQNHHRALAQSMTEIIAENMPAEATGAGESSPTDLLQFDFAKIVESIRQTNPEILEQAAKVRASELSVKSAKSRWLPTLSVQSGARTTGSESAFAQAKMPVLTFGRQSAQVKVAEAELGTERSRLVQVETEVIERLFRLASQIVGYQAKLQAARISYDEQYAILEKVTRRASVGYASQSDLAFVSSKVNQTDARIQEFEVALNNLRVEFATLAQVDPRGTPLIDTKELEKLAQTVDEGVIVKNNPEIQVQGNKLAVSQMQLLEIRLADRPSVDLTTGSYLFGGNGSSSMLGIEFNYNYGQLGRTQATQAEQQRAVIKATEAQMENLRREKLRDYQILDKRRKFITSATLPLQQKIITGLETNIASFARLYQAGRKSLFELLNTHRELSEARIQRADMESQIVELNARIAALGGQISRYSEPTDGE